MAFRVRRRRDVNIMRVGVKVVGTVIGLYASGYMLTIVGSVMNGTASPFYTGLKLIGWTVSTSSTYCSVEGKNATNCITDTSGSGILAVIGLLAIVWILFEFVEVRI